MDDPGFVSTTTSAGTMAPGVRIGGRYEVVRPLGRGGFGHTFLARDVETGRDVALKTLHDRSLANPKTYELFEREAAVLKGLRHRGVPELLALLRTDVGGMPTAVLVLEYVEGMSLAEMIDERVVLTPAQVLDNLLELLDILDYLHTRVPPVLHRDIKPANVIVRQAGGLVLVDFGAVRTVFRGRDEGGSTVVGTYGYMPYEQYMGQASASSDLYAVGATFLHLLTGRPPADFMSDEGHLETPDSLPVGEPLRGVIARLLRPVPGHRFASARDARLALLGAAPVAALPTATHVTVAASHASSLARLGDTPRDLQRGTEAGELFRRVAYGPWRLMNSAVMGSDRIGAMDIVFLTFLSVATVGVLPASFYAIARARRNRLRPFFHHGIEGLATIATFNENSTAFGEKLIRIGYDFSADGRNHRGSDQVHPAIAERLRPNDTIEILYLPDRSYDSVIVGGH